MYKKAKSQHETSTEAQRGQGEAHKPSEEMFRVVIEGLKKIRGNDNVNVWVRRAYADRVRYCIWENQSPDGKKRKRDEWDVDPEPFNGASDARVRLVDMVIQLQVAMCMAATKAANLKISSVHVGDPKVAGFLQTYCSWLLNSRIAGEWELETERLANYMLGDSPAVALLHTHWERETGVRMVKWGKDDFLKMVQELGMELDELMLDDLESLFSDVERSDELLAALQARFPTLKLSTLRASLSELREEGSSLFPEQYLRKNEPSIEAMRILEDVYVPSGTRSPRRCRVIYRREWYSAADLDRLVKNGELSKGFVEEVKMHEGRSGYPEHARSYSATWGGDSIQFHNADEFKDLYEVIWAYMRASNDDGALGVYILPFSQFVTGEAGAKMKLLEYPDGEAPFVWFIREATSRNVLDARGMSELLVSDQNFLKTLRDVSSDHAQLAPLPPFMSDSGITERELRWKSLALIRKRRQERIEPIEFPDLPASNGEQKKEIMQMVSMYTGLDFAEVSSLIQGLLQQSLVDKWLGGIKVAVRKILQMSVHFMEPERFMRLCGAEGDLDMEALKATVDELPDIEIDFNVDRFNLEYITAIGGIIKDILLAIDTDQTIVRSEAVQFLAQELSPRFARAVSRPVESATESEIKDEQMNFALIMAGVEPEMKEGGQNFAVRLGVLQEIVEGYPGVLLKMDDEQKGYFDRRVEHLGNQIQQQENAVIGRTMGQRVQDERNT